MTTTPTSGAADLPEALTEYLEAQDALDNREYAGINAEPYEKLVRSRNHARAALESALAAGQATAAQGVAYAELPDDEQIWAAREAWSKQANEHEAMRAALIDGRASHGQAPAQPAQPIACSYGDNGYACCEGGPCQADVHNDKLAEQQAPARAPADSVQEDAARESEYRRGYRHGYEQRDAEVRGALA